MDTPFEPSALHDDVRRRYAEAALAVDDLGCCDPGRQTDVGAAVFGGSLYDDTTRSEAPETASVASLGCGNPVAVADLRPGEVVLDLGSGAGLDVILSARRVGPDGMAYGLDMTEEMIELARRHAVEAGVENVRFLQGMIEDVPLPDGSVDVVISNCVLNLAPDAGRVAAEIARVLRAGGRVGISDVVADDGLTPADRAARGSHVECFAGASTFSEYRRHLESVGLDEVTIEPTHLVADRMWSAIVRATKPA